jgi:hypothetical protein
MQAPLRNLNVRLPKKFQGTVPSEPCPTPQPKQNMISPRGGYRLTPCRHSEPTHRVHQRSHEHLEHPSQLLSWLYAAGRSWFSPSLPSSRLFCGTLRSALCQMTNRNTKSRRQPLGRCDPFSTNVLRLERLRRDMRHRRGSRRVGQGDRSISRRARPGG